MVLIARRPRHIVARVMFGRDPTAIAFISAAATRPELPLQFVDLAIVKRRSPGTTTRAWVVRRCGTPLLPVGFVRTIVRRPIALLLEPARLIVPRIFAARFVVTIITTIIARARGRIHLPPCIAIAKIYAALLSRTIRAPAVVVVGPRSIVFLWFCWIDDSIKPLANGHAGSACGVARRAVRVRTGTSLIPWTARFHFHVQSHAEQFSAPSIPPIRADVRRT
jgi:hypothetical protein